MGSFRSRLTSCTMSDSAPAIIRTRKFMTNRLLQRKQMIVDVIHPARAGISKNDVRKQLATMYKCEEDVISTFGFRAQFGGGKTTGFALVYDNTDALRKFEPKYRQKRLGIETDKERVGRQIRKTRKNKAKKVRGIPKKKKSKD